MIEVLATRMSDRSARGLADAFSRAVRDGQILPGQRLPSIRSTAKSLGLSPTTVSAAWRLLQRANLIHTDGARGTVVASGAGQGPVRYGRATQYQASFATNLSSGLPDPRLLPHLGPSLRRIGNGEVLESFLASPILAELEECLRSDWPTTPDRITITDGATDALDLITMTFLQFGDRVAVENPSYPPLLDLLDAIGARSVPLDLDAYGPTTESVSAAVEAGARAVFIQPRAHNPAGVCLNDERASRLATVLRQHEALVVEFDLYGAISSAPLVSLSPRLGDKTIHIRGFSASHGPDLRLAAVGGPSALLEPLIRRRHLGQGWTSRLLQRLLLDLLTEDEPRQKVERARSAYRDRRRALCDHLARFNIAVMGSDGLTAWVPVENEAVALMILASQGIGVAPGSPYLVKPELGDHIAITVGLLPPEETPHIAAAVGSAAQPRTIGSVH